MQKKKNKTEVTLGYFQCLTELTWPGMKIKVFSQLKKKSCPEPEVKSQN